MDEIVNFHVSTVTFFFLNDTSTIDAFSTYTMSWLNTAPLIVTALE